MATEGPKRPLPESADDGQLVLKKQKTGTDVATASQQPAVRSIPRLGGTY